MVFRLFSILLLSTLLIFTYGSDRAPPETVREQVAQPLAAHIPVETATTVGRQSGQVTTLKNPTFQELREFILKDPTSRNKFIINQYECRHFATDVNNNAEGEGLRCAFVLLCYQRGQHAVVAFETTDEGLVYIEPQTDARIRPEIGGEYQEREIKEILIAW